MYIYIYVYMHDNSVIDLTNQGNRDDEAHYLMVNDQQIVPGSRKIPLDMRFR